MTAGGLADLVELLRVGRQLDARQSQAVAEVLAGLPGVRAELLRRGQEALRASARDLVAGYLAGGIESHRKACELAGKALDVPWETVRAWTRGDDRAPGGGRSSTHPEAPSGSGAT